MAILAITACEPRVTCADDLPIEELSGAVGYVIVHGVSEKDKPTTGTGSCVHLVAPGWFITNTHVCPGRNAIDSKAQVVLFPGTKREVTAVAHVAAMHPDLDLTLLRCDLAESVPVITIGNLEDLALRDEVSSLGYPFGSGAEPDGSNPSVMVSAGAISGLRRDANGRLLAIDSTAPIWGGNSGGALVDRHGRLIGINTWRYGNFGRAIPVNGVQELLGLAALDVTFDPPFVGDSNRICIQVQTRGPAVEPAIATVQLPGKRSKTVRLKSGDDGMTGEFRVRDLGTPGDNDAFAVVVELIDNDDRQYQRTVWLPRRTETALPLQAKLHWIRLKTLKANGWPWDTPWDGPDIFSRIYVNDVLRKETRIIWGQHRSFPDESIDLRSRDRVRILVYDKDAQHNDFAGTIEFVAGQTELVQQPADGEIDSCYITIRPVPPRIPVHNDE